MAQGKGKRTIREKETREMSPDDQDARQKNTTAHGEELKKGMDEFIDEIDEILEENKRLVKNFVQRGGE